MKFKFKNQPLTVKLWLGFATVSIIVTLSFALIFLGILKYARDYDAYSVIKQSQALLKSGKWGEIKKGDSTGSNATELYSTLSVYHIGIVNRKVTTMTFSGAEVAAASGIIETVGTSFSEQKKQLVNYRVVFGKTVLYYIILKNGNDGIISFMLSSGNQQIYSTAITVVSIFTIAAIALALLLALFYSRGLTKPLRKLEQAVEKLSAGELNTSILIDRKDEIGNLSKAVDKMRIELLNKDIIRQSAIQYVSHELKTPIMTIRSYANSITDGIFPKGDLNGTIAVIDAQTIRLERIVKKLISLAKLDYLESKEPINETVSLNHCTQDVCDRILNIRNDITKNLKFETVEISADTEQITVLIENLIENAIRHAKSTIEVTVKKEQSKAILSVYNDGDGINEEHLQAIFEPFKKGTNGAYGLGLSIVKRIADTYCSTIEVNNLANGVEFKVLFEQSK